MICDNCKQAINQTHPAPVLACPSCRGNSIRLERGDGWYCNTCLSGPYLIGVAGLVEKTNKNYREA